LESNEQELRRAPVSDAEFRGFAIIAGIGLGMIAVRAWADRSERGREAVRQFYINGAILHTVRGWIAMVPLLAPALILIGVGVFLPRSLGIWVTVPASALFGIAFVLSYQVPPPLAPRWMREELNEGRLQLMRPDKLDWLIFWIALPFVLLAPIGLIVLIVVYGAGQQ
jgi:hypothetical protein